MNTTRHEGRRPHHHPHRHPGFGRSERGPGMDPGERLRHGGFGRVPGFPPPPGFGPGGHPGPGGPGFGAGFGAGFGSGFGSGGPGGRGRHRGRGTRRGDVRAAVLALLTERPMHGYEIIQQIEERSGGVWRPSPGSIYPTLQLLADEGLVSGDETGGRRLFTLTDAGREHAARHEGQSPFTQERDETFEVAHRFREELGQLGMAVWQVAQVGTEEQRTEILGVLAEARRRAYQLLADGGSGPAPDADADPAPAE
ncbi:MAG TPA: PadR family transcriptional regulator [Mycobacteriales bacterium]